MLRNICFLALTAVLASCSEPPAPKEFNIGAFHYLTQQVAFGPRIPGRPGHAEEAAWLDSLLRQRADTVVVQSFDHVTQQGDTLHLTNFIARFNPTAGKRILYLAHWDTRPRADADSSRDKTAPVPGANDGASGVALLLGVADALKKNPPAIGVDLLFTDGEDYGVFADSVDVLIGSKYYARHPVSGPRPLFAVLWDMIADKDLKIYQEQYSLVAAPEVVSRVWAAADRLGYGQHFSRLPGVALIDDQVPLQQAGYSAIDVVDFDYPWWHTPDDTVDKVSAASLKIVGDVALRVIRTTN